MIDKRRKLIENEAIAAPEFIIKGIAAPHYVFVISVPCSKLCQGCQHRPVTGVGPDNVVSFHTVWKSII